MGTGAERVKRLEPSFNQVLIWRAMPRKITCDVFVAFVPTSLYCRNRVSVHDFAIQVQGIAQEMYRRMFDMKFLPPGRGLWAMGSKLTTERRLYAALNNCAFVSTAGGASARTGANQMGLLGIFWEAGGEWVV